MYKKSAMTNIYISSEYTEYGSTIYNLQNIDISIVNAIRRTIMQDIPVIVFDTTNDDTCHFICNQSYMNNQFLKQRLDCIPIHIHYDDANIQYIIDHAYIDINIENSNINESLYITTSSFHLSFKNNDNNNNNIQSNINIFPSGRYGYIVFTILPNASISNEPKKLHIQCRLKISTAKENQSYNVVCNCPLTYQQDTLKIQEELIKITQKYQEEKKDENEIKQILYTWEKTDAKRICKPNCYFLEIESIGIYTNDRLFQIACVLLLQKFQSYLNNQKKFKIEHETSNINFTYRILFEDEDHTFGCIMQYCFIELFLFDKISSSSSLIFCGYSQNEKTNPEQNVGEIIHDKDMIIIKCSYSNEINENIIKEQLNKCFQYVINIFMNIQQQIKN